MSTHPIGAFDCMFLLCQVRIFEWICNLCTAQKAKFSIKDFFKKCDQILWKLRIWSHLVKKSFLRNVFFVQWWLPKGQGTSFSKKVRYPKLLAKSQLSSLQVSWKSDCGIGNFLWILHNFFKRLFLQVTSGNARKNSNTLIILIHIYSYTLIDCLCL